MSLRMSTVELRELIRTALPVGSAEYEGLPPLHQVFVPKTHAQALHINIPVVLGERGMGKSLWWAALQSEPHRGLLARMAPDARIRSETIVAVGFGKTPDLSRYPTKEVLAALVSQGHTARQIWMAVIVWSAGRYAAEQSLSLLPEIPRVDLELPAQHSWEARVAWVAAHPEQADRLLQQLDAALHELQRDHLWLFDALDGVADSPTAFFTLVEGLCQVALDLRSFRHLRAKVFLRTDQFMDHRVGRFKDAARLRASTGTLKWLSTELYGLLWQLLSHEPLRGYAYRRDLFATLLEHSAQARTPTSREQEGILELSRASDWVPPREIHFVQATQEQLFHRLTGPYMGESARWGSPYRWLPNHLADAHATISPRSFLVALASAAQHTLDHAPEHPFPLHFLSLRWGVHEASRFRVREISEHRWVKPLMNALTGHLAVPFVAAEAEARWRETHALEDPDVRVAEIDSADSARKRLADLGVWLLLKTGRIDVPDIFRIGFGLSRRGGVPLPSPSR